MVNCFLCLVNLPQKSNVFNIVKGNGAHSKTSYGDIIGKLLNEQKLVITISDDNVVCETCDTLINAFDYHNHEQDTIKQIVARQIGSSYLKNKVNSICVDEEALATFTFDKNADAYDCAQCSSFRTNKIELIAAHYKAHQFRVHGSKTIVKNEVNEEAVEEYMELPIEEILLNTSACKYEVIDVEEPEPESLEVFDEDDDKNSVEWQQSPGKKQRQACRVSNDPVTNYTKSTRLPKYLRNVIKIAKTRTAASPKCHSDNLFVIEIPQIETVGHHFTCKICVQKYTHPLKLASHLLSHRDIDYSCNQCSYTISNHEAAMIEHMKWTHAATLRYDFTMDISDKLGNTCFRCGHHNNTIGMQCSHETAIVEGQQRFCCKICQEDFYGLEMYKNHMHLEHQLCRYCNKTVTLRFFQHKCLQSIRNRSQFLQTYYDISTYDWYQNKEEINYVNEVAFDVNVDDEKPPEVVMDLRPPKTRKSKTLKKPKSRSVIIDECQDKITSYFNDLFPIKFGEKKGESSATPDVNSLFCIDESSRGVNGMVKCKICFEEFPTTLKLRYHLIIHKNLTYRCQHCPIEVPNNEYGMRFHLRTAHENHSKYDFTITDSGEIVNVCSICSEQVEPGVLCLHDNAIDIGTEIVSCRKCPKTFYGDEALREHCHLEHCTCKKCQRVFVRPASLARHYVNHQNKDYFKCHTCQKVLSSVGTYINHLSEHSGKYKYSCDVCDRKFNVKLSYDEHLRGHDLKKKYICHICGQGFIHSATFLIHKIWHTNPLPFQCIVCKKLYRTRSALRMHDRKAHLKTPTQFCPECNKGLYSPADLKTHMVVHTGIYNYPCDLCPSKFFRSDRLRRHRKNCHGIEVPKKQIEYKVAIRPLLGDFQ